MVSKLNNANCFTQQWYSLEKPRSFIPNPVNERAFLQRASRGEGPCALSKVAKQKVSPGFSPADDNAGSLTPVEMTLRRKRWVNGKSSSCTATLHSYLKAIIGSTFVALLAGI